MKAPGTLLAILIAFSMSLSSKVTTQKTIVNFQTADYQLDNQAKERLKQLLSNYDRHADFEIFIEGHTDSRGSVHYNDHLSLNRSNAVKAYLLALGVAERHVTIEYRGEMAPAVPNSSADNMEVNRRVEVILKNYRFDDLAELESELGKDMRQEFVIDPQKEHVLNGKAGVRLFVPEMAFQTADEKMVEEEVTVELTEALDYSDFLAASLSTKSDGQILESGGMIKLSATTASGEALQLVANKPITIAIPDDDRRDDMGVFTSDGGANWQSNNQLIDEDPMAMKEVKLPIIRNERIRMPQFYYGVPKPEPPKKPGNYRMPKKPFKGQFERRIPWISFRKKKLRKRQEMNFQMAMEKYERRLQRYETWKKSNDKLINRFEEAYEAYDDALEAWERDKDQAFQEFVNGPAYSNAVGRQHAIDDYNQQKYEMDMRRWKEEKAERASLMAKSMDRMGVSSMQEANNYIFQVNNMSWINVDRFYHLSNKEKIMVEVDTEDAQNEKLFIVFEDIRSMLSLKPNLDQNRFTYEDFPKDEAAYIFAMKIVDHKPQICFKPMDGSKHYQLDYTESSFTEIKEILASLE